VAKFYIKRTWRGQVLHQEDLAWPSSTSRGRGEAKFYIARLWRG